MEENKKIEKTMDDIISLSKRKGFVYQGSEIYGGLAGAFDFGPLGVELLNNIRSFWWKEVVQKREDYYGLDSAMFKHPKVWEASGHTSGFSDPLAECRNCNTRIRVDKELMNIGVVADEKMSEEEINKLFEENKDKIKCHNCGKKDFSRARNFNMLIKSNYGDFTEKGSEPVYLPGEACQGIYLNFKNVIDSMHPKFPFGIAQINKAFRNEISPRNFLFRCREFEQADTQYFIRPNENKDKYEEIKQERWQWYLDLGLSEEKLRWHQHENLVFYAKDAWDIEYNYPTYGFDELEGIHDRTDYDLTQHSKFSGVDLSFNEDGNKFVPWILETSVGLGRIFLAVLSEAYTKEQVGDETRVVLKFPKKLAPIKVAFLPLSKKDELAEPTKELFNSMKDKFVCQYDETQSIGKRYRRQDEIGTPYCVTFDFDSLEDNSVTVRDRDTMEQERIKIEELEDYLTTKLNN
ncbi:glycine--tRNA ligase [Patescibacteria group bacterium]|nr:glycine--tRNA ligase [Patescibacteria group bacterium]